MRTPTVILDLSPIARDDGLNDWQLVEDVVRAWREREPRASFYGVADNSLKYQLDAAGQRALREWMRRGQARSVPFADPDVLELADEHHAAVITKDRYRDRFRENPWIVGSDRFFEPVFGPNGVSFSKIDMAPIPEHEQSMRIEAADLKPLGLTTPAAKQALLSEWSCSNPACVWNGFAVIDADPKYVAGKVVCPECERPAERVGALSHTREVVVLHGGTSVGRFPVPEGMAIVIGREGGEFHYDVREALEDDAVALVSRKHLSISNRNGSLVVEDLHSKNGTELVRERTTPLTPGVQQRLSPGDIISVARGAMQFRLSGKRRVRRRWNQDLTTPPWLTSNGENRKPDVPSR